MGVGVAVFAASFAALGGAGQTLVGTLVAIAIFSLAETVFTPMVHTAFASLREGRSLVEVNNLRQVAATAGESTGSFAGGALFVLAAGNDAIGVYWGALAVLGVVACLPYLIRTGKGS